MVVGVEVLGTVGSEFICRVEVLGTVGSEFICRVAVSAYGVL